MNPRELIEKLAAAGYELNRQGKGSHAIYTHKTDKSRPPIIVPVHKGKEIKPGLAKAIMKQAGIR